MPQFRKVSGLLADRLEKDAQILGKGTQQAFRPLGQMTGNPPLRQPFGNIRQLVDVDAQGHAVIFRAGIILVIHGIFRSFTGDFIRKTIQQVFPPEFVHGFLRRNMQSFRVFLLHTGGPPQKSPGRTAVRGNKPVKEFKNSFLTPDLVRTAQLQLYLSNLFPERFQIPDTGGVRAETTAQQTFTYHYFPRMGGIDTAIVHTPVINNAQTAAHDAFHCVNSPLLPVPPRSGIV